MDVGDASDHRVGNVYESIAGVWFIERKYDKIMDLLCFIIDIQAPRLDSPMMPEALRGSESLVWGGLSPLHCSPFRNTVASTAKGPPWRWSRTAGHASSGWLTGTAVTTTCAALAWRKTTSMERGRDGGARRAPGSGPSTAAGLPQGTPMIPVLRALLPPPPAPAPPGGRAGRNRTEVLTDVPGLPSGC